MVRQPRVPLGHPERASASDDALDPAIDEVVRCAVLQGWTEEELAHSMIRLGHERLAVLRGETEEDVDRQVDAAIRVIHGLA